jgi:hypothetical protein
LEEVLLQEKVFDPDLTRKQLLYLDQIGREQSKPYWNFGYDRLTEAVPTLRAGLFFIVAVQNTGKSAFLTNLGYNLLAHNPDCYWLDFTLDDSQEKRNSYLIARVGNLPINLIRIAGLATEEEKVKRKAAFVQFSKQYRRRYRAIGVSSNPDLEEEVDYSLRWILKKVADARAEIGEDMKLVVSVDSFYDVDVSGNAEDENRRLALKSAAFKRSAAENDCLYILSAHTRKDSNYRGATLDVLKGEGKIAFDANVAIHLYSDVGLYGENADICWYLDGDQQKKYPVIEGRLLKNKEGEQGRTLFFDYLPPHCYLSQPEQETEAAYMEMVKGLTRSKKWSG